MELFSTWLDTKFLHSTTVGLVCQEEHFFFWLSLHSGDSLSEGFTLDNIQSYIKLLLNRMVKSARCDWSLLAPWDSCERKHTSSSRREVKVKSRCKTFCKLEATALLLGLRATCTVLWVMLMILPLRKGEGGNWPSVEAQRVKSPLHCGILSASIIS